MGLHIGALIVDSQGFPDDWPGSRQGTGLGDRAKTKILSGLSSHPKVVRRSSVVADLLFIEVPEPKRARIACISTCDPSTSSRRLPTLKALREPPPSDVGQGNNRTWVVMADPEGNEFCIQDAHPPQVRAQWLERYEAYQPVRTGT